MHPITKLVLAVEERRKSTRKIALEVQKGATKARDKEQRRKYQRQIKEAGLKAYGNKCACCGEHRPNFLTIDHVRGDGAAHRAEIGLGKAIYGWLRKNNYPQDGRFQVLCFNCNLAKGFFVECPHEAERRNPDLSLTLRSG
jgi:hypothetical protein